MWLKRQDLTGKWRESCNGERHDLYFTPNNTEGIKSRRI
jgi:hypothetical protein